MKFLKKGENPPRSSRFAASATPQAGALPPQRPRTTLGLRRFDVASSLLTRANHVPIVGLRSSLDAPGSRVEAHVPTGTLRASPRRRLSQNDESLRENTPAFAALRHRKAEFVATGWFRAAASLVGGLHRAVRFALLAASALFFTVGASALDKTTVVLDWTVNTNHTGLYVAQAKGWFQDEGLDVDIQPAPDTGAAGLLASGRADFAYSYQEEILQSRAGGLPLTAIAAVIQNNTSGFASRKTAGIHRPKDFEGKRYGGYGSPIEEGFLRTLMKADGGDFSKVTVVNLGEQDFFAATEKNVDFAWVFEGWTVQEANVRGIPLDYIDLRKVSPVLNEFTPVLAANDALLAKNPAKVRAFLRAVTKGYQYAIAHPDDAAAILLKAAPELNAALVKSSQKFLAGQYQAQAPRWGEFDAGRWNGFAKWMTDNGVVANLPAGTFFTNDYLPK